MALVLPLLSYMTLSQSTSLDASRLLLGSQATWATCAKCKCSKSSGPSGRLCAHMVCLGDNHTEHLEAKTSALDAKLPLSPAELTLFFFINSLTMQLGGLRKSPPLREVIRQAGNVWTSHPERLWGAFPEVQAPGGWSGFVPEVWAQGHIVSGTVTKESLRISASWPRSARRCVPCSLDLPPGSTSSGPA